MCRETKRDALCARDYVHVLGSASLALSRRISDTIPYDVDGTVIMGKWWSYVTWHFRRCFALMVMRLSWSPELCDVLMERSWKFVLYLYVQWRALLMCGTAQVKHGNWTEFRWNSIFEGFSRGNLSHRAFRLPLMYEKHVDDWLPCRSLKCVYLLLYFDAIRIRSYTVLIAQYFNACCFQHRRYMWKLDRMCSCSKELHCLTRFYFVMMTLYVVSCQLWYSTGWSCQCLYACF